MSTIRSWVPDAGSAFWLFSIIGGACAAVGSHFDLFPMIGPHAQQWIELVSLLWTTASAAARVSPLHPPTGQP